MSSNVYEIVTERILQSLDKGVVPWRQPWTSSLPKNLISKKTYRGVNIFLLGSQGFSSPYWLSYKQATSLGGQVRKGEKGTPVIFWKKLVRKEDGKEKEFFILRYFTVFNVTQCDNVEYPQEAVHESNPIEMCEDIVNRYGDRGPYVRHGGGRACYVPSLDEIQMPERNRFRTTEEYYSTRFHEMTHSTGAERRLNRKGITDPIRFASHDYSFEELVAECGAAFLCAHGGIVNTTLENSVAYIRHWSEKLRSEPRWIVEAASAAAKSTDFILNTVEQKEAELEMEDG